VIKTIVNFISPLGARRYMKLSNNEQQLTAVGDVISLPGRKWLITSSRDLEPSGKWPWPLPVRLWLWHANSSEILR